MGRDGEPRPLVAPMIPFVASVLFCGCGLVSCVVAHAKGYRPWFWPLSLGPVGTLAILAKAPLSRAKTPEIREVWEQRTDWTGGILSGISLCSMCAAALVTLFGISIFPSAPGARPISSAVIVDGVSVKYERPAATSVNTLISPFIDGERKGMRYNETWLDDSGKKVGHCFVEIANGEMRINGKDYGPVAKDDTVEIAGDRVTVNGELREAIPVQP